MRLEEVAAVLVPAEVMLLIINALLAAKAAVTIQPAHRARHVGRHHAAGRGARLGSRRLPTDSTLT